MTTCGERTTAVFGRAETLRERASMAALAEDLSVSSHLERPLNFVTCLSCGDRANVSKGHGSDGWAVRNIEGQSLLHCTKQNANDLT